MYEKAKDMFKDEPFWGFYPPKQKSLDTPSFGGWHEAAVREVERLGAALARQSGQEEDEAVRHLWGKLGMLLQRGNAAILANRVPTFPAPAIDGRH